jgi:hypothetical protein
VTEVRGQFGNPEERETSAVGMRYQSNGEDVTEDTSTVCNSDL